MRAQGLDFISSGFVMVLVESAPAEVGSRAPHFELEDCEGKVVSINDVIGEKGLLVIFMCNHCPYVIAKIERIVKTVNDLEKMGIGSVAIMPNDFSRYTDDSPEKMKEFQELHNLPCKYLVDKDQDVARAYEAQCTPEFHLYTRDGAHEELQLIYRGRLDSGGKSNGPSDVPELYNAALEGKAPTGAQYPSMGCSIKWKETE